MNAKVRLLTEEDLPMVMDWRMRPYITKYMNTDPKLTIEGQLAWYRRVQDDPTQIQWVIELDDVPIGIMNVVNIDRVNSRCSWGYYIAETEMRSLKLAVCLEWNLYDFVFDDLKLHKLCAESFVKNEQVVKLHLMCGSKQDGVMRDQIHKNGVYYDVSIQSILSEEWQEKKSHIEYEKIEIAKPGGIAT